MVNPLDTSGLADFFASGKKVLDMLTVGGYKRETFLRRKTPARRWDKVEGKSPKGHAMFSPYDG
jgi:hypothetical protein